MSEPTEDRVLADAGTPDPKRWLALVVVLFAAFMDLLDSTIVNVALPSIQRELGASYSQVQWVVAAYLLAFAVVLITGGRLGDIVGRRRMFLIGVTGFTVASIFCGFAATPEILIGARVLQGIMAACMVPQVLSIITATFPPAERGGALGAFGGIAGLATVGGPIVGAALTNADLFGLGWRAVFLINVPVGVILVVAALLVVRESRATDRPRLDIGGAALVSAGLLLLLFPLVEGRDLGWPAWLIVLAVCSVPVLALFVMQQKRRSAAGRDPLLPLQLFASRSFSAGLIANFIFFAVVTGHFLIYTIFLQEGLGYSVLAAGLTGLPWSFGTSFGAAFSATVLTAKLGRKVLVIGSVLLGLGLGGLALTVAVQGADVQPWPMLPALLVGGLGMGMIVAPILDFILSDVDSEQAGAGSGVVNTVQQIGGVVGIAVISTIFFGLLGPATTTATGDARVLAAASALERTIAVQIGLVVVVLLLVFLLPRRTSHSEDSWASGPAPVAGQGSVAGQVAR
ncbi:MFS transporter [Pseudonocardia sp. 73-21]|uniref:MFS transporter n=1 Tax=Pseudonocardia sp. 73-21 TaxID=1895809 RepID=UPI0009598827|nr:MFS transporter [Pseudonocardia sp. 73-21]OJY38844.1 MAG: hypothetical protein BGP03_28490 [Pseudonocardia sp. 73-21]